MQGARDSTNQREGARVCQPIRAEYLMTNHSEGARDSTNQREGARVCQPIRAEYLMTNHSEGARDSTNQREGARDSTNQSRVSDDQS